DGLPSSAALKQTIFGEEVSNEQITPPYGAQIVEFTGVAPGHYELEHGNPPRIADLDTIASQQLDASLGKPAVDISGTLRTLSGTALPDRVMLSLESFDAVHGQVPHSVQISNGQFSFESNRQGNYEFMASTSERQLPIISITIGNRTHPGNRLTVT